MHREQIEHARANLSTLIYGGARQLERLIVVATPPRLLHFTNTE
jgi:hypothetical protein